METPTLAPPVAADQQKPKRKRAPWVYKFQYDNLKYQYRSMTYVALIGWTAFIIALFFAV